MPRLLTGIVVAAFAAAVLWAVGPVMRETDQASLIDGAWQLRHGGSPVGADFHAYDKQFLSYLLATLALPESEAPLGESEVRDLVARINWLSGGLFMAGVLGFAAGLTRFRARARGVSLPLLAFLTAPAVLLSAPLASSAVVSAAFVLALAGLLSSRSFPGAALVAGVLAFLATGARADALLCMPILCWSMAKRPTWSGLCASPMHWSMAAGTGAGLSAGILLAGESTPVFYEPFFLPQVVATYLLFGLGALLPVAAGFMLAISERLRRREGFWVAGVVFLLLPAAFYAWQLFSPRHLFPFALAIVIAAAGRRGRALWRANRILRPGLTKAFAASVGIAALTSLAVGVHLPSPEKPRLAVSNVTSFPTADGLWPMGATLPFLVRMRSADSRPIDHNQETWNAVIDRETRWPESNAVPVLETPMRKYLFLGLRLAGRRPVLLRSSDSERWLESGFAVADERSLQTLNPGQVNPGGLARYESRLAGFSGAGVELISPEKWSRGVVLLSSANPDSTRRSAPAFQTRRTLAVALQNEDFRLEGELSGAGEFEFRRHHEGRTVVFSSPRPFAVGGVRANRITGFEGSVIYAFLVAGDRTLQAGTVEIESRSGVTVWTTVLPDYMSRNRFREAREIAATRSAGKGHPREIAARFSSSGARGVSAP